MKLQVNNHKWKLKFSITKIHYKIIYSIETAGSKQLWEKKSQWNTSENLFLLSVHRILFGLDHLSKLMCF